MSTVSPLGEREVRLMAWNLDKFRSLRDEAWALLSADERTRAEAFKIPLVAERFILARGLLRRLLGGLLERDPASLRFDYGPQGKPSLTEGGLEFNLSHSGSLATAAVARGRRLGVDLEQIRSVENESLAERYFSPSEAILFRVTPPEKREEAFFHYWTAKEAFLKARGDGMSLGLKDYSFSDPWESPPRLTWVRWDAHEADQWAFHRFWPEPGYIGTLAYASGPATVKEINDL